LLSVYVVAAAVEKNFSAHNMCCLRHVITALLQQYIIGPVSDFESLDNNVLAKLRDAKVLAFDCEGVDLSRLGPISLVSIATLELCVIFDVLKAERTQGVVDLLKDLLESPDIIKVIHDAKMDVDALHHQLGISPMMLHDTQAWDQVLTNNRDNLNRTLVRYGCRPNPEMNKDMYKINYAIWATRPLTQRLIDHASGNVKSLCDLRQKQQKKAQNIDGAEARCIAASAANASFYKKLMKIVSIRHVGRFIGPRGSNLNSLTAQHPGVHFQTVAHVRAGNLMVFAEKEEHFDKVLSCISVYK